MHHMLIKNGYNIYFPVTVTCSDLVLILLWFKVNDSSSTDQIFKKKV